MANFQNSDFSASFDLEGITTGLASTMHQGTKECGARPTCIGWSEGCKQKQQAYYECTKVAAQSKAIAVSGVLKVAIIGSIVLGAIIVVAIMFKRK